MKNPAWRHRAGIRSFSTPRLAAKRVAGCSASSSSTPTASRCSPTTHAGEARELAARFAAQGEPVVIAAGGDGTLNEVVSGLAGSTTVLGILPAGTMNVFARELGIPFDSLDHAFAVIERGFVREVDLFAANGAPFLQMAGVGFDAAVIEETTWKSKKMLGPLAYLLAAVKVLGERPPHMEVVCADGRREEGVAVLVGNGALYGGPFRFFRNADNRDSKLDVLVYKEAGYRLVLDSLRGLACGGIDLLASTSYFQTEVVHGAGRPRGAGGSGRRVDRSVFGSRASWKPRTTCACSPRKARSPGASPEPGNPCCRGRAAEVARKAPEVARKAPEVARKAPEVARSR